MQEQIYPQQWVQLKPETRAKLREIFLIPKTSFAQVVTDHMGVGTVVSDGTTIVDLQSLTVEKMRDYLGTAAVDETVYDLFKRCIEKLETIEPKITVIDNVPHVEYKEEGMVMKNINVNKCPDCEYTHASKQGLRMHILKKHLHK